MAQTKTDLELALEAITNKIPDYDELYSYYDGNPTLKYSTERIQRALGNLAYFAQNWASVIINAVLDRLVLKGFDASNDSINNKIDEIFTRLNLNLESKDVHEAVQVTGEAFLIVDKTEDGVEVYFNDPRMCEMFYNNDRPKKKGFAAKKWLGADNFNHIALYYPDRTEKYVAESGETANSYSLVEIVPNETGVIPVFHFRKSRRIMKGELDKSVISVLDAINKLFSDLIVAAEFETFKTKIFISQVDPGEIKIGPDMKLWMPARETPNGENTQVIELGGADLERFTKPINDLATSLSIQTRTPRHYFVNIGSNVSGEALIVEESALVKKVIKEQESYAPEWQAAMAYVMMLEGKNINANELVPVWDKPQSEQPLTEAQVFQTNKSAGIPLITTARRRGWSEDEIAQLESDMKEDDTRMNNLVNDVNNQNIKK